MRPRQKRIKESCTVVVLQCRRVGCITALRRLLLILLCSAGVKFQPTSSNVEHRLSLKIPRAFESAWWHRRKFQLARTDLSNAAAEHLAPTHITARMHASDKSLALTSQVGTSLHFSA